MSYQNNLAYAQACDQKDPLKAFRNEFHLPKVNGKEAIYLCGNSLGLQPKSVRKFIEQELEDWQNLGVEGHFHGKNPWFSYHHFLSESSARLVGALPEEVVVMNALTVNLHLLMVSFYRPTKERYKIIIEDAAFPSDWYAVSSQAQHHGFNPKEAIVALKPREGEHCLRTEDILQAIEKEGDQLALVMLGGVNYYTGQFFNLKAITDKAHEMGALAGFDCAHAVGNVPMQLHDWQVDFAVWCSYKYLNSGPGGSSGAFVHKMHGDNTTIPRFAGWWGNNEKNRFDMAKEFKAQTGAAGWQLSNAQVLPMASLRASLELFDKATLTALREKSLLLTSYLEFLLNELNSSLAEPQFEIISPKDTVQRGCQLSILTQESNGQAVFDYITKQGVIADWRKPNVIRVAPVPMYNSFEDVYRFVTVLGEGVRDVKI